MYVCVCVCVCVCASMWGVCFDMWESKLSKCLPPKSKVRIFRKNKSECVNERPARATKRKREREEREKEESPEENVRKKKKNYKNSIGKNGNNLT